MRIGATPVMSTRKRKNVHSNGYVLLKRAVINSIYFFYFTKLEFCKLSLGCEVL
jgi:hypothetical protein